MESVTVRSDQSIGHANTEVLNQGRESQPTLRLRLKKPRGDKKVGWREGTVDNELMNKKKSKCCCIYKKPVAFGESSSEDDEDCENCFGHPEKRKRNKKHNHEHEGDGDDDGATCSIKKPLSGGKSKCETGPLDTDQNPPVSEEPKTEPVSPESNQKSPDAKQPVPETGSPDRKPTE